MIKGGKPVVLVVEDDEPIRNLITTTLEMEKYKFDTAQNGSQALCWQQPTIRILFLWILDFLIWTELK